MRRIASYTLIVTLILATAFAVQAKPQLVEYDDLQPELYQRRAALVISQVLEGFHYTRPDIDNRLSELAFDRYLSSLDNSKLFFTRKEIDKFEQYRDQFDDDLLKGRLNTAFVMFKAFRHKVEQRIEYALELLRKDDFDFSLDENFYFDRKDQPWASSEAELDDLWRKRVKNDLLSSRLSDSEGTDLTKRYQGILRRVQQMNSADVFETFINAFALSIEPHTSYMSPRISENFDIGMSLRLQGIGAVLRSDNEYTEVVSTVVGGPAARSGKIAAGDKIVGVGQDRDGTLEDVVGWRLQDVVDVIRGPKDSVVRLLVLPKDAGPGGRQREITLVRDEIKLEDKAAKAEVLEGPQYGDLRIGVIDIPAFYRDFAGEAAGEKDFRSTTRDVRQLLKELQQKQVDGIVVDLRENGGGSLTEATELTGLFIEQGPVVQVKDMRGQVEVERDTDPELVYGGPLAVLVDRNSASASEIFAGAIQDYRRGLIIGEPTFGKGTVQTLLNLQRYLKGDENVGRLRLTMAQFFRVEGDSTQHRGVMPDIQFPTAMGAREHGERALEHALPFASIRAAIQQPQQNFPLAALRQKNDERIAKDPGFRFLLERETELERVRESKSVSLNEKVRRAERDELDAKLLASRNRLRAFRGLEPLTSLEEDEDRLADAEEDEEGINRIMLDESAQVLVDFIKLQRPMTAQVR